MITVGFVLNQILFGFHKELMYMFFVMISIGIYLVVDTYFILNGFIKTFCYKIIYKDQHILMSVALYIDIINIWAYLFFHFTH